MSKEKQAWHTQEIEFRTIGEIKVIPEFNKHLLKPRGQAQGQKQQEIHLFQNVNSLFLHIKM